MKKPHTLLALAGLLLTSSVSFAATDSKTIDIEVTQGDFVELVGSAMDGNVKTVTLSSIQAGTASTIGTLGVNSNLAPTANCDIAFSTINNFRLRHETSGDTIRNYFLTYNGANISSNADTDANQTLGCQEVASNLDFTPNGTLMENAPSGVYKDTVTVTITTP